MIDKYLITGIIFSLIGIVIYARVLYYLLKRIKVKSNFKKELIYSFALFVPLNLISYFFTHFLLNPMLNVLLLLALIAGIVFPIKYIYKIKKWKPVIMVSVMWLISILVIGFVLNFIAGLILLSF